MKKGRGTKMRRPLTREKLCGLRRVIHVEFHRMGGHAETRQLLILERDVGLEEVLREHAAAREERMVVLQAGERMLERGAAVRHLFRLLRRQVGEVLVD